MIDVLVSGAAGKMGSEVVRAVTAADGMRVVAAVDTVLGRVIGRRRCWWHDRLSSRIWLKPSRVRLPRSWSISRILRPSRAIFAPHLRQVSTASSARPASPRRSSRDSQRTLPTGTCLFMAPNFAIGAVLMMDFAAQAAQLHASCRDHRAAPRQQGRCPFRHCDADRIADRRMPATRCP